MSRTSRNFYRTCESLLNSCESILDKNILSGRGFVPAGSRDDWPSQHCNDIRLWAQANACANSFIAACPELPPVVENTSNGESEEAMDSDVIIIDGPEETVSSSNL